MQNKFSGSLSSFGLRGRLRLHSRPGLRAKCDTYLKKRPRPATELANNELVKVPKGREYGVDAIYFLENETPEEGGAIAASESGHYKVDLASNSGTFYLESQDWLLPYQTALSSEDVNEVAKPGFEYPNANSPGLFYNPNNKVSRYFIVGEVTQGDNRRIPKSADIAENILTLARVLDEVREWYGQGLIVTSWYRPPAINRAVGGARYSKHLRGHAVDIRPADGNVGELQRRFKQEWYDTGRWQGGFGLGANRGFIHLDLRTRLNGQSPCVWVY
ncbi:MAG: hypothetical protein F6J86_26915 [Symploca sp. SIO1B1]|nr:hypothetical protein [Symploca sp. SIO1B1]